jgi:hypothetical protein
MFIHALLSLIQTPTLNIISKFLYYQVVSDTCTVLWVNRHSMSKPTSTRGYTGMSTGRAAHMQQRMNEDSWQMASSSTDLFKTECHGDLRLLEPIIIDQNGVTDGVTTLVSQN